MTAAAASVIDADFLAWLEDVMAQLSAAGVTVIDNLPQPLNLPIVAYEGNGELDDFIDVVPA